MDSIGLYVEGDVIVKVTKIFDRLKKDLVEMK